jgi:DNA-binding transcriptional regulator YiaG
MPSVARVLREEMGRVSRGQIRSMTARLRKQDVALRQTVQELKRRVAALEARVKSLTRARGAIAVPDLATEPVEMDADFRPTGQMVRRLRKRLGVSQEALAKLLNITAQSVYLWERKGGRLNLRSNTFRALLAMRKVAKREAQRRLIALMGR